MPLFRRTATIVEGLMRKFALRHELTQLKPDKLFETFSAYCVTSRHRVDFEPDELRRGCPNDRSIDAYAIVINDVLYTHADDVRQAVSAAAQVDAHFIVVQAKHQRAVSGGEFGRIAHSIANIFGEDPLITPFSPGVQNLRDCVRAVYAAKPKFTAAGSPVIHVWYTNLGNFRESAHTGNMIAAKRQLAKLNLFRDVQLRGAGAQELRELYRDANGAATVTISLGSQSDLPRIEGVNRTVLGVMRARDVIDGILADGEVMRRYLFHNNFREFLDRTDVNLAIEKTLRDPAQRGQFAVLNNGITIVTKRLVPAGKHLVLTDPQIINGCQTCNLLWDNRRLLDDSVTVAVRVIESVDRAVIDRIIEATNRQNALDPAGSDALNEVHRLIEDYFEAQPASTRLYYERRLHQHGSDIPRSRIVKRRHLTQAYASMWLAEAHNVTRYVALEAAHKDDLYQQGDDPLPYYTAASVQHQLTWLFGLSHGSGVPSTYREARFHLLAGVKLYLAGDGPLPTADRAVAAMCNKVLDAMWDPARSREVVTALIPAVHTALGPGIPLSELGSAVRTALFGKRFREAVMEFAQQHRAVP